MRDSVWKVDYTVNPGVRYVSGPLAFPDNGLRLVVVDAEITRLEHRLSLPGDTSETDAVKASREALDGFINALRFLQLAPLQYHIDATRLEPPEPGGVIKLRGHGTVTTGARAIVTPPHGWNGDDALRLSAWLSFASEAQESPSPATALRLYYLVIEELRNRKELPDAASRTLAHQLEAIRDFVSHAELKQKGSRDRLRRYAPSLAVGPDAFRYRPSSAEQRAVLEEFRQRARVLVDTKLKERLGVAGF